MRAILLGVPHPLALILYESIIDLTAVGRRYPYDHSYRRCLPRPVRPQKSKYPPAPHVKAQIIDGRKIAKALGDVLNAESDVVGHSDILAANRRGGARIKL